MTGIHGVTEAQHNAQFRRILNSTVVPAGTPPVCLGQLKGILPPVQDLRA
jgi:hypothetical protein